MSAQRERQDDEAPWIDNAIADLERLAGEAAVDPLLKLWVMWRKSHDATTPDILTGEESDHYGSGLTHQTCALERQIMKHHAETLIGAFVHLSVFREWTDNGEPMGGEAIIKDFHDRADSTLRDAAAKHGFEVPAYPGPEGVPIPSD